MRQALALAQITQEAVDSAAVMARSAQASRDLHATGECDMSSYPRTAEGRTFAVTRDALDTAIKRLTVLSKSAGFDPRKSLNS